MGGGDGREDKDKKASCMRDLCIVLFLTNFFAEG